MCSGCFQCNDSGQSPKRKALVINYLNCFSVSRKGFDPRPCSPDLKSAPLCYAYIFRGMVVGSSPSAVVSYLILTCFLLTFRLQTANSHVFFRTTPYHPPFVSDPRKLKQFLEELLENSSVAYTEEDIVIAVKYFGGSLVTYIELVKRAKQYSSLRRAFQLLKEQHLNNVKKILFFDEEDTVTDTQRALGLRCYNKLKLTAKEHKTEKELSELRVYTDGAVQHLLRTREPTLPLVGISPETCGLVLSWPGTAEVVQLLENRAKEVGEQHENE